MSSLVVTLSATVVGVSLMAVTVIDTVATVLVSVPSVAV